MKILYFCSLLVIYILPIEDCSSGNRKLVIFYSFQPEIVSNFYHVLSWLRPFNILFFLEKF